MSAVTAGSNEPTIAYIPQKHLLLHIGEAPNAGEPGPPCETACPINYTELYNLKGRLFTLVDATFQDPQQRKAQKDVVWQALQAWMNDIELTCGYTPHPTTAHSEGP